MCSLCFLNGESINHLFFHCLFVKKIWVYFFNIFGMVVVFSYDNQELLWSRQPAPFGKKGKILWRYISIIIIWTTWEERNLRIFQDKRREVHIIEVISYRVAVWASSVDLFQGISTNSIRRDMATIARSSPHIVQYRQSWRPPIDLSSWEFFG